VQGDAGHPRFPVNRFVDKKRMIGKNGGPKRRRGTRGCPPLEIIELEVKCIFACRTIKLAKN
jgi:hypothetical protein